MAGNAQEKGEHTCEKAITTYSYPEAGPITSQDPLKKGKISPGSMSHSMS